MEKDNDNFYSKNYLSKYVIDNYEKIDFSNFKKVFDTLEVIIENCRNEAKVPVSLSL